MYVFLLWFKEAFNGLVKNFWWNSVAFLMSVVCLLAFSVSYVAGNTAEYFSHKLNERLEIQVDIKEGNADYSQMESTLKSNPGVTSISFISKEQAEQRMIKEMGEESAVLEIFDGRNIFPASFIIKVKNANEIEEIATELGAYNFVDKVLYGKEYIDTLLSVTSKVEKLGYYATIGGSLFVVFLIMWVIRMNIAQRKDEIGIKQLIGSSMLTIRMPFVLEALMLMILSSVVTFFLFSSLYGKFVSFMKEELPISSLALLNLDSIQGDLIIPLFGLALGIGIFSSVFSTSRHLKRI